MGVSARLTSPSWLPVMQVHKSQRIPGIPDLPLKYRMLVARAPIFSHWEILVPLLLIKVQFPLDVATFCCQAPGQSVIQVIPIPDFDTVVGDTTVWDPQIAAGIVDLTQIPNMCACDINGPALIEADPFPEVTAQYTATQMHSCQ